MNDTLKTAEVAVLGAGPGGYAAAFRAADLGLDVTLIDVEENPGGVCLYRGCIPSKALLHVARVITEAREAKNWGITFAEPDVDIGRLRERTGQVVEKLTGGLGQLTKARGINWLRGRASFVDSRTLRVSTRDNGPVELPFEHCILASGSRPYILEKFLINSPRVMSSTIALRLDDLPENLLVVGGGYIGLELGSVYATLGSKVTVVEMTDQLLPGADADLVEVLARRMGKIMHRTLLNTQVTDMKETEEGIRVVLDGPDVENPTETFDKVLICIGRRPNSSGLALKTTDVETDDKGFVKVDGQLRTSDPAIFAVGDLVGQPMLAHKASHEGFVAAEVLAGKKASFDPRAIPAVVFTDPEVAWAGLMEQEAEKQGREVKVSRFPWAASGRAATIAAEGLTKLVTDPETGVLLGIGIVGQNAGEMISEGVLAIEMGALAEDIESSIHPHPTLGETIMESAEAVGGRSTHIFHPKPPKERAPSGGRA